VAGRRTACLTAVVLTAVVSGTVSCSIANPAADFCSSYGKAMHGLVVAAREYQKYPDDFTSTYKSTMDSMRQIRAKAPDDRLRGAFDTAAFTFSVFDGGNASLADFLTRADFSGNAVVTTCAEYGVEVTV